MTAVKPKEKARKSKREKEIKPNASSQETNHANRKCAQLLANQRRPANHEPAHPKYGPQQLPVNALNTL